MAYTLFVLIFADTFANFEHESFASSNSGYFAKNDKFRAFNFAKIDKRERDVLKELHVQEEEMSDSDEESAEVEDK